MAEDRIDPYAQYSFILEIDGLDGVAGFTEAGGLTTEQDVIEYREGKDTATVRKLPGLRKYSNINLKRGFTDNRKLWEWRKTTIDGKTERKAGSIILQDESQKEALRWNFIEGWIAKWEGPTLNATANEAAIESLEIAIEGLELVK